MGATRNTGYIENLIAYDGNNNIGVGGPVNVLYKVTIGGNTLVSGNLNVTGTITFSSNVTANSFVKNGGVATEFLKADGTVDTSTYATVSYVDTSISNLIDAAPAALNTLNELAAALGDDSSFSTTVTTALGNRLRIDTDAQGLTSEQKANGRTNLGVVIGTDVQAYDADLGAIAALTGTSGFLKKTAANTWTLDTGSYLDASTSSTQNGYFGNIYLYDDSTPSHYLAITNSANLTAARTLSINVNDVDRTISLSGNLTVSAAATISGTNTGDQTDITGNSATADKWKTERTITVGATGKTVDGSANVSWTLAEIGAAAALSGASGRVAYWNSNTTIAANDSLLFSPTSTFAINNVITAAAGGASAFNLISTVNAAANNDTLYGVRISPTFNNGAFTGVTQRALGVFGDVYINGSITAGSWQGSTISVAKGGTGLTALGTAGQLLRVNSGATALEYFTPSYLTSYTETDTLQSVISRGATTNTGFTISNANDTYSTPASTNVPYIYLYNTGTTGTSNAVLSLRTNSATGGDPILSFDIGEVIGWSMGIDNSDSDKFKIARSWSALDSETRFSMALDGTANFTGNLTAANLSGTNTGDQDLSGYVTLAGAQTISGAKTFNNDLTITNSRVNVYTGGVGAGNYGIVSGYANSNHLLTMRANITGPTATPTFTYGHQMCFVEYAEANDTTGWFFKTSATTNYTEVARITRSGINWNGNTVLHAGNYTSYALATSGGTISGNLNITGSLETDNVIKNSYSGSRHWSLGFDNASNQKANLEFDPVLWGWFMLEATCDYNYANRPGRVAKIYYVGLNPGGAVYSNESRIIDSGGPTGGGITFSNITWTGSKYRVTIVNRDNASNNYKIKLTCFMNSSADRDRLLSGTLSGVYTSDSTAYEYPNPYYNNNVGFGGKTDPSNPVDVTGIIRASNHITTTGGNLHTNRGRVAFSSTAGDANHTIYNNYTNIDGEGTWDGMKMNVYNGLDVRTGAYTSPTTNFTVRSTGISAFASNGPVAVIRKTGSAPGNNSTMMVRNDYGNHSWGITAVFQIGAGSGTDRPSILFNHDYNSNNWGVGFCSTDDNFRIVRDHGYQHSTWGTQMMLLDRSGNVTFTGDVTAYSDVRLKTDINKIENAIEKISKINGVTFKRIDDIEDNVGRIHAGVIAQEVLEVLPEVVSKNTSGYYQVAYGNMVGLLIEAIKEQQKQIEELKSQIKNK